MSRAPVEARRSARPSATFRHYSFADRVRNVSGKRAKDNRRVRRERPPHIVNAEHALRSANAVLAVGLSQVPLSHVNQFAVGWMRAAFEQSRIIANLTSSGFGYAAAPNRRAFWEIALRLLWLADKPQEEREAAADTMLQLSRDTEVTTDKHMREMDLDYLVGMGAIADFDLN